MNADTLATEAAPPPWWHQWLDGPGPRWLLLRCHATLSQRFRSSVFGLKINRAGLGRLGEDLACAWLRRHGRKVLHRNFRGFHGGEVDIVARHRDVLTFVEVKTRTSAAFGRPADAVTPDKQRLIQRGAQDWLRLLDRPRIKFRFDIVEVLLIDGELPRPNIIENAFQMPDASTLGR